MNKHLQRALVLLEQSRFDLAEKELVQALAEDPNDAQVHAYLAICLNEREAFAEATAAAERAIGLAPDWPYAHFVLASVYTSRKRYDEAFKAIQEALRLDPEHPGYYAALANIHLGRKSWSAALTAAERGLRQDPEHVACSNCRAQALNQLGRSAEAVGTVATTLARNPEEPYSHANLGWTYLHQGDSQKALEHFREALRLEPGMEFARAGLVEALKARYLIYGLMLRYFLWMARLSGRAQWGVILGGYVGYRILLDLAQRQPGWAPWINPLLIAYVCFAILTWIAVPLFNLLLRLNRYGRHALSRDQRIGSTVVGLVLLPALIYLSLWLVVDKSYQIWAIYFGLLLLPVSAIFNCDWGWPRCWMVVYTIILATLLPASRLLWPIDEQLSNLAQGGFLIGAFLSGFVANFLIMSTARH